MALVLLFAAYERLLHELCRSLLEAAAGLRVGVHRLRPGFKLAAVINNLHGVTAVSRPTVWKKHGPEIIAHLERGKAADLPTQVFPSDGSYMKRSQVVVFCDLFELDPPGPILKEVWSNLDWIVVGRNDIAHGTVTADDVGRRYTTDDLLALTYLWKVRWLEFADAVETQAAGRDFYRRPR